MPWKELEPDKELLEYLRGGRERKGLGERFEKDKIDIYLEAFREWYEEYVKKSINVKDLLNVKDLYNSIPEYLPSPPPELTQEEIQKIVEEIEVIDKSNYYSKHYKGIFISYLVNNDEIYHLDRIEVEINGLFAYLGLFNQGKEWVIKGNAGYWVGKDMENGRIVIEGGAGDYVGERMESGRISVGGDAGDYVGKNMKGGEIIVKGGAGKKVGYEMEGGKIIVKGNAGKKVGMWMLGGEIIVNGDAGDDVGEEMQGGEIRIKGAIGSLSDNIYGGSIYIWDDEINDWKLIVENGKKLV